MKKQLLLFFMLFGTFCSYSQGSSIYSIESEYTTTFGYRYFFDKTNSITGVSTQLCQLPVAGYYLGSKMINCYGNYVFCGVDSSTSSPPYLFKLYELDTLGNLVRTLPVSTASGYGPDLIHFNRSLTSPLYYGIKTNGIARDFVSIDPITGATAVLASINIPNYTTTPNSVIASGNDFYFVEQSLMTSYRVLFKVDFSAGTIAATDSVPSSSDIINLAYDCVQDSIVGFCTPFPYNVSGSEWIKVNSATGKIRHTGTYFSGAGYFYSTDFTFLNGGDYYAKVYSSFGILFDPATVTGASYTPPTSPLNSLDLKLMASPEDHCSGYYSCAPLSVNDIASDQPEVQVFPNPFNENTTFVISSGKNGLCSFEMTDVLGRKVREMSGISEKQFSVSREGLQNGVYFYKIFSNEGVIGAGKVIIQ